MSQHVGFIGLGNIGFPIAARIYEVLGSIAVWNRTPAKAKPLVMEGARLSPSPGALGRTCDIIALCLTSDNAVEAVVFGPDGLLDASLDGREMTIVNLSTGAPFKSREFADRAASRGARWLDSPVSGGVPGARKGALTLFLGGDEETISRAKPLLEAISRHRTLMGPAGSGQITKLCNQMIVATNLLAIAQAVTVGRKAGIDVVNLATALAGGFADSAPLQLFGPRMADHVYEPRLGAIRLMLKDVDAAQAMAERANAPSPVVEFARSLYRSVSDRPDLSLDQDLSALVELFERA